VFALHTSDSFAELLPEFHVWLNASPENRDEFTNLERIWRDLDELNERGLLSDVDLPGPASTEFRCGDFAPSRRQWTGTQPVALAAGILLVIGAAIGLIGYHLISDPAAVSPCEGTTDYHNVCKLSRGQHSADYGQTAALNLVDGSEITLDANSQVTLDLTDDHRRVQLDRGEALFKVSKDDTAPFDVQVGSTTVRAVGTIFSVENKGDDTAETVVQKGKVLVRTPQHEEAFPVKAGEVAEVDAGEVRLRAPSQSKVDARLSWTAGLLSYDGETLSEVAAKFNRYNRDKFIVDAEIAGRPIAGLFSSSSPRAFADALEQMLSIHHSISHDPESGAEIIHLSVKKPQDDPPRSTSEKSGVKKRR
jgi:ferric-dicitrate binding protein FerR (iron transport regulator)